MHEVAKWTETVTADNAAAKQHDALGIEIKCGVGAVGPSDYEGRVRSDHAKTLDPQIDGQIDAQRETLDHERIGESARRDPGCLVDADDGCGRMLGRRLE